MTPHTARTWARKGSTPVVRVNGGSRRHLSVATSRKIVLSAAFL
jgi:hypothetical protein